jgi:putative transcriptional regulator
MSVPSLRAPFCLVSSPLMSDPFFANTVILVAEYSEFGALGFIINRPKPVALKSLVKNSPVEVPDNLPTWYGGPVGLDSGIVLANQRIAALPPSIASIPSELISVSSDDQAVQQLVDFSAEIQAQLQQSANQPGSDFNNFYAYRFVVGYAGWGPGQLEDEIKRGTWLLGPMNEKLLFSTPWDTIWTEALNVIGLTQHSYSGTTQSLPI